MDFFLRPFDGRLGSFRIFIFFFYFYKAFRQIRARVADLRTQYVIKKKKCSFFSYIQAILYMANFARFCSRYSRIPPQFEYIKSIPNVYKWEKNKVISRAYISNVYTKQSFKHILRVDCARHILCKNLRVERK